MPDWIQQNEALFYGLAVFSVACFVLSLIMIPVLVVRLPRDYFARPRRSRSRKQRHPAVRMTLLVVKNILGVMLVLAGVAMLALPGQGVLTILVGLVLTDFPGKYALQRRLVCQRTVWRSLNWIRAKAGKPPLVMDVPECPAPAADRGCKTPEVAP